MENKAFELKIEDGGLRIEDRPSRSLAQVTIAKYLNHF